MRKRNKYNLSNYKLFTGNMGYLYPIAFYEVLPGDTFLASTTLLVRCDPLVAPPMHPVNVTVHHFFVPYRLIMDNFEQFITSGSDGDDNDVTPIITLSESQVAPGTLANYFGIPPVGRVWTVNSLLFRAYNLIWNERYRDQDLQKEVLLDSVDLLKVNVEKDYFTIARPSPQKGTDVTVPLDLSGFISNSGVKVEALRGNQDANLHVPSDGGSVPVHATAGSSGPIDFRGILFDQNVKFTGAGLNLSDLATSVALKKWKERRSMYGSRYSEYLADLGIKSSDSRLQTVEYLGGGQRTIQFSEVVNTGDSKDSPLGTLKGHGVNATRSNSFKKFFEEHGLILSLMFVRPKNLYSTSIPRFFLKNTRVDFWNKELEQVGQQPIYKCELDSIHSVGKERDVFAWTDHYQEYRQSFSSVAGDFSYGANSNNWHFAREFANMPALNSDFVESNPTTRPFAITDPKVHHLKIMAYNSVRARRLVCKPKVTTL